MDAYEHIGTEHSLVGGTASAKYLAQRCRHGHAYEPEDATTWLEKPTIISFGMSRSLTKPVILTRFAYSGVALAPFSEPTPNPYPGKTSCQSISFGWAVRTSRRTVILMPVSHLPSMIVRHRKRPRPNIESTYATCHRPKGRVALTIPTGHMTSVGAPP